MVSHTRRGFMHLGFRIKNRGFWFQRNGTITFWKDHGAALRKVDWSGFH